jgi:hypothetical protein
MNAGIGAGTGRKKTVRHFEATVTYHDSAGQECEEAVPVYACDYGEANRLVFAYVLQVLRLSDFELRLVGA